MNTGKEPKIFDAVLGGGIPSASMVLGGLAGIRQCLQGAENRDQHQEVLKRALDYGEPGAQLIAEFLQDEAIEIRWTAYYLLQNSPFKMIHDRLRMFSPQGVYYGELQKLLRAKRWASANQWTQATMKSLCRVPMQINPINIRDFPCADLGIIDRLWQEHSQQQFGFSTQAALWKQCSQQRWDENRALAIFGDRVGWRQGNLLLGAYHWKKYEELIFDQRAPKGHLPWINGIFLVRALHDRIKGCQGH